MLYRLIIILFIVIASAGQTLCHETSEATVDFAEKTGAYAPTDTQFMDEGGKDVTIRGLIHGGPAVLTLIYFKCPEACNPLLNNLAEALANQKLDPKSFTVITISISPDEGPADAAHKKEQIMHNFQKPFPPDSWRFLTGTDENIDRLADSIGFSFRKEGDDYVHPLGLVFIAPDGKITRYLHGTYFLPFDLQMGLLEASKGKIGPPVMRAFAVCYGYDPASGKYVFRAVQVAMVASLLFTTGFMLFLFRGKKKKKKEEVTQNGGS